MSLVCNGSPVGQYSLSFCFLSCKASQSAESEAEKSTPLLTSERWEKRLTKTGCHYYDYDSRIVYMFMLVGRSVTGPKTAATSDKARVGCRSPDPLVA